jgi:hypothetical protein
MEQAGPFVLFDRHLAKQLGELAGGEPPRQVHLEKPVLAVDESRGVSKIDAIRSGESRNAEAIPLDPHGGRKTSGPQRAVQLWQRGSQHSMHNGKRQ